MTETMKPRFESGEQFYDTAFYDLYTKLNYPPPWIQEGKNYSPNDAYSIMHPTWMPDTIPATPDFSIYELFQKTAKRSPDEIAVIFLDKKTTYKELDQFIGKYATLLKNLGVKKGDVVAAILPNSLQHILAFYGAAKIGAVHSPINVMYQTDEIAYQLADSNAKTIVILDLFYGKVKELHDKKLFENIIVTNLKDYAAKDAVVSDAIKPLFDIPKQQIPGTIDMFDGIKNLTPTESSYDSSPKQDIALVLYTAGTTGPSKGVVVTHFNAVYNSISHTHAFKNWNHEVNFSIMPMFHTAGYYLHLLPVLYQGGTVIPIPMFDVKDAFRIIETYKVNVIFAPPTLYIAMFGQKELTEKHDLSSLIFTIACGAPVPHAVQKGWLELTGIKLVSGWGMTETNSGGIMSIPGIKEKSESIGVPIISETKIIDEKGNIVPRNEEGEIAYRGLQLAGGYLNKKEQTKESFLPDGWFKTGDRGFIDTEDFIHFVDRIKDLIIASGYNLAPTEVENVIYQLPGVAEAAVIGIPDEYRGETVKAVVVLTPEAKEKVTPEDIIDYCRKHLATFKVPRVVEIRDALPKSAVGKILRRALREEVTG